MSFLVELFDSVWLRLWDSWGYTLGEQHDVPVYDFAAEMPPDRKYWNDGIHVNAEGATLKGRLFAEFLESSGLLPTVAR